MFETLFNNSFPRTATRSLLSILLPLMALAIPADGGSRPVCLESAPRFGRLHQPVDSSIASLTATSLNLATETSFRKILRELDRVRLLQSDLFFFQEVEHHPDRGSLMIDRLAEHLGYDYFWIENLLPLPFLHRQVRPVLARLKDYGYRTPFTQTGRTHAWAPLKLDWIFLRKLRTQKRRVQKIGFSDHRALWVQAVPQG